MKVSCITTMQLKFRTGIALWLVVAGFVAVNCDSLEDLPDVQTVSEPASSEEAVQDVIEEPEEIEYSSLNLASSNRNFYLYEHFDDEGIFEKNWIKSEATKSDSQDMLYDGEWGIVDTHSRLKGNCKLKQVSVITVFFVILGDRALIMLSKARHHAIGAKLSKPFIFQNEKSFVLQYEVQFRNGQECGGAYVKLLAAPSGPLSDIHDTTPYSIMFGPDKCGNDYKVHFIFMHRNPQNGTLREIHWKRATSVSKLEEAVKDSKWHLLRLHIRNDNTFEVQFDKKVVGKGSLFEEFNPAVNPAKEIDDPYDSKPEDWDEREKIPDPDATKPEEWDEGEPRKISDPLAVKPSDWEEDETEMIPDPDATKPSDWDPDMDGEWEAPLITNPKCSAISGCGKWSAPVIDNPKYRGKWKPSMISNPNYKGKWAPRKIPNPEYFEDSDPYSNLYSIDAAAFELWTISDNIAFDNVLITNDVDVANYVLDQTFQIKKDLADSETDSMIVRLIKYTNKRPWLWAVYILVIALPVVLFIAFCCVSPVKSSDDAGTRKKTDASTADVIDKSSQGTSRQQLNKQKTTTELGVAGDEPEPLVEESESNDEDEDVNDGEEPAQTNGLANGDVEEDEDEEEEAAEDDVEPVRTSPRLRKLRPRKE